MNDREINTNSNKIEEAEKKGETFKKSVPNDDKTPSKRLLWGQAIIHAPLVFNDENYEDRIKKSKKETKQ